MAWVYIDAILPRLLLKSLPFTMLSTFSEELGEHEYTRRDY
jgi:hypothetical protein